LIATPVDRVADLLDGFGQVATGVVIGGVVADEHGMIQLG
jgi:hypothetical protein